MRWSWTKRGNHLNGFNHIRQDIASRRPKITLNKRIHDLMGQDLFLPIFYFFFFFLQIKAVEWIKRERIRRIKGNLLKQQKQKRSRCSIIVFCIRFVFLCNLLWHLKTKSMTPSGYLTSQLGSNLQAIELKCFLIKPQTYCLYCEKKHPPVKWSASIPTISSTFQEDRFCVNCFPSFGGAFMKETFCVLSTVLPTGCNVFLAIAGGLLLSKWPGIYLLTLERRWKTLKLKARERPQKTVLQTRQATKRPLPLISVIFAASYVFDKVRLVHSISLACQGTMLETNAFTIYVFADGHETLNIPN